MSERRFELQHPRAGWEGEIQGVRFVGGRAATDDPRVAHALMEHGVVPVDTAAGRPAFGLDEAGLARLAEHADRHYPSEGR